MKLINSKMNTFIEMARLHYVLQQTAPVPWKWSTTIIASIALWFCCTPLAFCGLLYAIHSYVDHKVNVLKVVLY